MVHLTPSATVVACTAEQKKRLRQEFARRHCVCLPNLLDAALLQQVQGWLVREEFTETTYQVGTDSVSNQPLVFNTLHLVINDPSFLNFIGEVTGFGEIGRFRGRVYRMLPDTEHEFVWHSDTLSGRLVGMSLNLSVGAYSGGVFELRHIETKRMLRRLHNTGPGSAFLFRISQQLEHRVTPVTGGIPKTTFAGWFLPGQSFHALLKEQLAPAEPPAGPPAGEGLDATQGDSRATSSGELMLE